MAVSPSIDQPFRKVYGFKGLDIDLSAVVYDCTLEPVNISTGASGWELLHREASWAEDVFF